MLHFLTRARPSVATALRHTNRRSLASWAASHTVESEGLDKDHSHVIADIKDDDIVKLGITDIDGILRGKYVRGAKLKSVLKGGMGFCSVVFGWDMHDVCYDNSQYTGWHTGYPDMGAELDPRSARKLPWERNIPFFLLDFREKDGSPCPVCPRALLRRVIQRGYDDGYTTKVGPEFEFFNYDEDSESLHAKGFVDPKPLTPGMFGYSAIRTGQNHEIMKNVFTELEAFGVPLEGLHTETGPGVLEAAIHFDDALEAADRSVLFKYGMKVIGHHHNFIPTFMAKVAEDLPGCSGHLHLSLHDKESGKNLFYDDTDADQMSETFKHYLAGQMKLLPELLVMFCPNVNSYKRLVEGYWAPIKPTWGVDNRTVSFRVLPGGSKATRLEHRVPGSDNNPYLAVAAAAAAGMYGVANKMPLDIPPVVGSVKVDEASQEERLPRNLLEATQRFHKSEVAREMFGDEFVEHFARTRLWEWRQFNKAVTDWETKRYFELV